jgi:hypothetical protein
MMNNLKINALVAMSAAGHYFSRVCLRGCRLHLISQNNSYRDQNYFEYSMRGEANLPPYTLLTCWQVAGEAAGTYLPQFWIIQVNPHEPCRTLSNSKWGDFFSGQFETLAYGDHLLISEDGIERATLLSRWWQAWAPANGGQVPSIARWLGKELLHSIDTPHSYPHSITVQEYKNTPSFNSVVGWEFEDARTSNWFGPCP